MMNHFPQAITQGIRITISEFVLKFMSFVPPKMQTELLSSGNDRIRFPVNKLMENFKKKLLKQCNLHKVLMLIHPLNAHRSENTQVRYT